MVLEKIIQGLGRVFSRRDPLAVDPDLLTLLVETCKSERGSVIKHLKKDDSDKIKVGLEQVYVVYVHDPGTYKIEISDEEAKVALRARFKKPGVYLMHPCIDQALGIITPEGTAVLSMPEIRLAPFNSKISYATVLGLFQKGAADNRALEDHFELAAKIRKKRDALPEDETDYHRLIFHSEEKPSSRWYKPLIAASIAAAALVWVKGYYDEKAAEQRELSWKIEHDTKNLMFENELARKQELERIRDAEIAAKRKAEEEIRKKLAEEDRIRTEKLNIEHWAKLEEIQAGMKKEFQNTMREKYKDAEITDLVWKAYCSNPVLEKDGPNWSITKFTVHFKDYAMKVSFRTDRTYHNPDSPSITYIRTAIIKNGKEVSLDQKGKVGEYGSIPDADKQAVQELVQKHDLTEVRKNIIDAVIEERGCHRAGTYNGRE